MTRYVIRLPALAEEADARVELTNGRFVDVPAGRFHPPAVRMILHRGRIVYERYFGVLKEDGQHGAMSVTKSFVGTLGAMLVAEGRVGRGVLGHTGGAIPVGGMLDPVGAPRDSHGSPAERSRDRARRQ